MPENERLRDGDETNRAGLPENQRLRDGDETNRVFPRAGGRVSESVPTRPAATGREQRVLEIIKTARAKRARFRDKQITLAHGAGGKATQTLPRDRSTPTGSRACTSRSHS